MTKAHSCRCCQESLLVCFCCIYLFIFNGLLLCDPLDRNLSTGRFCGAIACYMPISPTFVALYSFNYLVLLLSSPFIVARMRQLSLLGLLLATRFPLKLDFIFSVILVCFCRCSFFQSFLYFFQCILNACDYILSCFAYPCFGASKSIFDLFALLFPFPNLTNSSALSLILCSVYRKFWSPAHHCQYI